MRQEIEMRLRSHAPVSHVISGSTPVPSFGNAECAAVATLGINPSCAEFVDRSGCLLTGAAARFVSLSAARVTSLAEAPIDVVEQVYSGCIRYFQRNPYRIWFDRLDEQLRAIGASYYDGSAAHLDLAHWATNPVWGKLSLEDRSVMLEDGHQFLQWQLAQPHLQLVLLNGRTVLNAFAKWSGVSLTVFAELTRPWGQRACLYTVQLDGGPLVLGWSTNLQSSYGVTKTFRRELAETLARAVRVGHPI